MTSKTGRRQKLRTKSVIDVQGKNLVEVIPALGMPAVMTSPVNTKETFNVYLVKYEDICG